MVKTKIIFKGKNYIPKNWKIFFKLAVKSFETFIMNKNLILLIMIIAFSACASRQANTNNSATTVSNWTEAELNTWYENNEWLNGWQVKSDNSNDKRLLAESYSKFKDRWDMAFQFLKSNDLRNLSGRHDLDGNNVYVLVSDYNSKEKSETRYEVHRKYVDIQYVAVGEEYMGKASLEQSGTATPYNEATDIEFFDYEDGNYFLANQETFFIFFPDEVHRSSIKVNESVPVKRIIVKLLVE
jgi:YhcH/YjgK/YiaL family protein